MTLYALHDAAPEIAEDTWIAPGAHLIGRIVLEPGASVWFNATLRGDNEPIVVGRGSNIQENCVLHTDMGYPMTIGPDCTIGHKAMLHGCTIGAGALITEGKEIPDGSLVVGAPGQIKRQLDEKAQAGLRASAEGYVANMRRFRDGLRPL